MFTATPQCRVFPGVGPPPLGDSEGEAMDKTARGSEDVMQDEGLVKISITLLDQQDQSLIEERDTGNWLVGDEQNGIQPDDPNGWVWDPNEVWSVALMQSSRLVAL